MQSSKATNDLEGVFLWLVIAVMHQAKNAGGITAGAELLV